MHCLNQAIARVALAVPVFAVFNPCDVRAQADRVVVLVRHAERAAEATNDPPLSAAGLERATALVAVLRSAGIGSVISTPFRRTMDTAAPFAAAAGLTVDTVGVGGGLAEHLQAVAEAVRSRPSGEAVLVVGHSNTVPGIIGALGGPELPDLCEAEHANLFVLILTAQGAARLIRSTYGAPDPADADQCQ